MTDAIAIRLATHADDAALVALKRGMNVAEHGWLPAGRAREDRDLSLDAALEGVAHYWRLVEDGGGEFLVAEISGRIVGCVLWHRRRASPSVVPAARDQGAIGALAVDPVFRGRGVGERLMDDAEARARASGLDRLVLGVMVGNEPAQALYAKRGYQPIEQLLFKKFD